MDFFTLCSLWRLDVCTYVMVEAVYRKRIMGHGFLRALVPLKTDHTPRWLRSYVLTERLYLHVL